MKCFRVATIGGAAALPFILACILLFGAGTAKADDGGTLRKINVSKEGDHLYVKLTGTTRFRYRVKSDENPPRLTVQLYGTEADLGYNSLAVNEGYVKDLMIQQSTVSGQKATFVVIHLNQNVAVDYGLSGDGRTLYVSTPLYAEASDNKNAPQYSAEAAAPPPSSGQAQQPSPSGKNGGALPPEINVPANAPPVSEMVPYSGSGAVKGSNYTDFPESKGADTSPYIVGPIILQDADISKTVQLLSEAAGGASIIVESSVLEASAKSVSSGSTSGSSGGSAGGGGITMTLSNITLEDALDVITSANNWVWKKVANSYLIISRETAMAGLEKIDAAQVLDVTSEKLQITLYKPKYYDSCTLLNYVKYIVPSSQCDSDLNYVILKGRYEDIQRAKDILVTQADTPRPSGDKNSLDKMSERMINETGGTLSSHVYRLKYIRAEDLQNQLKALMQNPYFGNLSVIPVGGTASQAILSKEQSMNTLSVDKGSNTLVFLGREEIWKRIQQVVQQLDVPFNATIVRTIQLQNASADDLKTDISNGSGGNILTNLGRTSDGGNNIVYNNMANTVTFIGTEDNFTRFQQFIQSYDSEDKAIVTDQVFFNSSQVSEIWQNKMMDPILNSPNYGYAQVLNGNTPRGQSLPLSQTRITFHVPTNSIIIEAQRRYMDRIKEFLRSLDVEQQKLVNKLVKVKYIHVARALNALEIMLDVEDGSTKQDNKAPFYGNFYSCGEIPELDVATNKITVTVNTSCDLTTRVSFKTSHLMQESEGRFHVLSIYADSSQNALLIRGIEPDVKRVLDVLATLDVPVPHVRIDVRVVEVNTTDMKDFSKRFNYTDKKFELGNNTSDKSSFLAFDTSQDVVSKLVGFIDFLVENDKASLLANPSIVTRENVFSRMAFQDVIPYMAGNTTTSSATGSSVVQSVSYLSVGPDIFITPHINTVDNTVMLSLIPIYSSLVGTTPDGIPYGGTHVMQQEVTIKSGETLIASGFIQSSEIETRQKVPILGDLPLIGNIFRSRSTSKKDKEVIFMFTPTILPSL